MRVLMMTQAVDAQDPGLGFTASWVRGLASRVDRLHVLCLRAAEQALPPNVSIHVAGARNEVSGVRRMARFTAALRRIVPQVDIVLGHMVPRYVWAAAPFARLHGRPIVFWYTHRQRSLELHAAVAASARIVTAVSGSFPVATARLRPIGHGIETAWWADGAAPTAVSPQPLIVQVARLAPIKHQATLIEALARLAPRHSNLRAVLIGGAATARGGDYRVVLERMVAELGLQARVVFAGALGPADVRSWVHRADIAVNLSPPGLFDKAALETMAAGVPTIVADDAFDDLNGEASTILRTASPDNVDALASTIERVLTLPADRREDLAAAVRANVVAQHDLAGFVDRLVDVMQDAIAGTAG